MGFSVVIGIFVFTLGLVAVKEGKCDRTSRALVPERPWGVSTKYSVAGSHVNLPMVRGIKIIE